MPMSDFVHLHLHTEYLAARRRLPRRRAARPGGRSWACRRSPSPSTATCSRRSSSTTTRGRSRRQADPRLRGLRRAGRPPRPRAATPGETAEPPGAAGRDQRGLPQPDQAGLVRLHRRLLLQAAHRQGAARAAQQGPDRPQQLPEGRGRRGHLQGSGSRRRARRPATYRDILGPDNFFLEMQYQGLDEQKIVNRGLPGIARELGLPMVCTNDVHYLRDGRPQAARHPALHRHRQVGQRRRPAALRRPTSSS